jgi:DNA-binding CsgD family transcriptional regulator
MRRSAATATTGSRCITTRVVSIGRPEPDALRRENALAPPRARNSARLGFRRSRPASFHRVDDRISKRPREVILTSNQYAIVTRIARGEKTPAIARAKKRSVDTVRSTLRTIYSRFNVRSADELKAGMSSGAFRIVVADGDGREHNLRSALTAIRNALTSMRTANRRKGTKRRRCHVSLHEDEVTAILTAHGKDDAEGAGPTE